MNARPYTLIFILLTASVVFILALQGFWLRNFYVQKRDAFNQTIYTALEKISSKLYERQQMREVKKIITFSPPPSPPGPPQMTLTVPDPGGPPVVSRTQVRNAKKGAMVSITHLETLKSSMTQVQSSDSIITVYTNTATVASKPSSQANKQEIDKLMDKMLTEIRIIDTDERNGDTIRSVIEKVLANKGIFIPFEFALKKVFKNKDEPLARSLAFQDNAEAFVTDLSADKVFSTHNYLFIQFPDQSGFVFSSIRNMLLLSLLFSLLIIGLSYYAMRLLLKQKKLSEVKNDFVNNMTHELKTPIATISLAIDSMSNPQVKNSEARFNDYTRILKEENKKLNDHVERVLQMAQLDKGELRLHKQPTGLVKLIEEIVAAYSLQIQSQQAMVTFIPPLHEISLTADAFHLQKVFSNLLDNALKYSGENCRIEISIHEAPDLVQICFKDNGIGIDIAQAEKIFERFYRVQGGNLHDVKGFGLGLSYARSIVEAHGGSISVQSRKGEGSEFTIHLKKYGR